MNHSQRLHNALDKLYLAFIENRLHPECACSCAVGTICDQKDFWKHFSNDHGSLQLNYVGKVHQSLGRTYQGYTPQELLSIENAFLRGCGYSLPLHHRGFSPKNPTDKDLLFDGLMECIQQLCNLDGIQNITAVKDQFVTRPISNYCLSR